MQLYRTGNEISEKLYICGFRGHLSGVVFQTGSLIILKMKNWYRS
jgi:hypothetical protein